MLVQVRLREIDDCAALHGQEIEATVDDIVDEKWILEPRSAARGDHDGSIVQ